MSGVPGHLPAVPLSHLGPSSGLLFTGLGAAGAPQTDCHSLPPYFSHTHRPPSLQPITAEPHPCSQTPPPPFPAPPPSPRLPVLLCVPGLSGFLPHSPSPQSLTCLLGHPSLSPISLLPLCTPALAHQEPQLRSPLSLHPETRLRPGDPPAGGGQGRPGVGGQPLPPPWLTRAPAAGYHGGSYSPDGVEPISPVSSPSLSHDKGLPKHLEELDKGHLEGDLRHKQPGVAPPRPPPTARRAQGADGA